MILFVWRRVRLSKQSFRAGLGGDVQIRIIGNLLRRWPRCSGCACRLSRVLRPRLFACSTLPNRLSQEVKHDVPFLAQLTTPKFRD